MKLDCFYKEYFGEISASYPYFDDHGWRFNPLFGVMSGKMLWAARYGSKLTGKCFTGVLQLRNLNLSSGRPCDGTEQAATARNRSVVDMVWHERGDCDLLRRSASSPIQKITRGKSSAWWTFAPRRNMFPTGVLAIRSRHESISSMGLIAAGAFRKIPCML
jgi:hypothetical protein